MKDINQLFRALRNTEPKFDYHSEMNGVEFLNKNLPIFQHAIQRCEMTGVDMRDMIEVAKKLLPTLPYKPGYNYKDNTVEDVKWGNQFGHFGTKRHKKGEL